MVRVTIRLWPVSPTLAMRNRGRRGTRPPLSWSASAQSYTVTRASSDKVFAMFVFELRAVDRVRFDGNDLLENA